MNTVSSYIKHSKQELLKVIFPQKDQIKAAFISVLVVVTFVSIFLAGVDLIMSSLLSIFV